MKKITTIEKDCLYLWIEKPKDPKLKFKKKDIIIGDSIGEYVRSQGMIKLKKFFEKDLKRERTVAYRYEKRFSKERDSKWFIISQSELNKSKIQGCKTFNKITMLTHNDFEKTNGRKPLRKKHYYYIVTF